MQHALGESLRKAGAYVHTSLDLFHPVKDDQGREVDRCVIATKPIPNGAQLLLIPQAVALTASSPKGHPTADVLAAALQDDALSSFAALVLRVLAEQSDPNSRHAPYLGTCPKSYDCLLGWSKNEAKRLKGTAIAERGDAAAALYIQVALPFMKKHSAIWPKKAVGLEAFVTAAGLVQSRAFHMAKTDSAPGQASALSAKNAPGESTELFMIPAIDMLNHATDAAKQNTALYRFSDAMGVDVDGSSVEFEGFFSMKAQRDIVAGEQILHCYGSLSDGQLVRTYGFVEGRACEDLGKNPHNFVLLPFADLKAACLKATQEEQIPQLESKCKLLQKCGILHKKHPDATELVVSIDDLEGKHGLPAALITCTQVLVMDDAVLKEAQEVAEQRDFMMGESYLDGSEMSLLATVSLTNAIQHAMKRYCAKEEELRAAVQRPAASPRRAWLADWVALTELRTLKIAQKLAMQLMCTCAEMADDEDSEDDDDLSGTDEEDAHAGDSDGDEEEGDESDGEDELAKPALKRQRQ